MRSSQLVGVAVALAAGALATSTVAAPALAQIAPGSEFHFVGAADAVDIGTPGIVLTFRPGTVVSGEANTGAFAALAGLTAEARSLTVGAGAVNLPAFLSLGGYTFDIGFLPSGTYGQDQCYVYPAPGQRCTPFQSDGPPPFPEPNPYGLSPFMLANTESGVAEAPVNSAAWFHVIGSVRDPWGATSDFVGTISADFYGVSFQEALYYVENGGVEALPFSGRFMTVAGSASPELLVNPEPSQYALMGVGLLGVAGAARRRRRAAR
jgi:hypothetical protein